LRACSSSKTPGGISIEIGGGPGFFKKLFPEVISTDLISCPWLDVVADAQALPFQTSTVTNVLGLDVPPSSRRTDEFLQEAERILVPGGRLVLSEPWITPFPALSIATFTRKIATFRATLEIGGSRHSPREKGLRWQSSNFPIFYLALETGRKHLPRFLLFSASKLTLLSVCLSAQFWIQADEPLPEMFYPGVSRLERLSLPLWRRFAALRVLLALEKSRDPRVAKENRFERGRAPTTVMGMQNKKLVFLFTGAYSLVRPDKLMQIAMFRRAFCYAYFIYKSYLKIPSGISCGGNQGLFQNGDILDIGANIGYTARVFAGARKPDSKVLRLRARSPDVQTAGGGHSPQENYLESSRPSTLL